MIDWDKALLAPLHATFGEKAEYRPKKGAAFNINVVFESAYTFVSSQSDGSEMVSIAPAIGIRDSEFKQLPQQGDKVFIYSVNELFIVREMHPDSFGGSKLLLNGVKK